MKRALITGVTGQDGAYLSELLLKKGYEVHGLLRRSASADVVDARLKWLGIAGKIRCHDGNLTDLSGLIRVFQEVQPEEVYNLAAQSFVKSSWQQPLLTGTVTGLGAANMLEAVRLVCPKARFYQASSSEMYGLIQEPLQSEKTPFYPRSPYAAAKLYAHWQTINYRESYDLFACNGILFNHESPVRGETFVTRKITRAAVRIAVGQQKKLFLGNLNAKRDWGHAKDYVHGMWLMLQQEEPEDFVLATGETTKVREFCEMAFSHLGIELRWEGEDVNEKGIVDSIDEEQFEKVTNLSTSNLQLSTDEVLIKVDPQYFRPTEVDILLGDASKAKEKLGWEPEFLIDDLVKDMVEKDFNRIG